MSSELRIKHYHHLQTLTIGSNSFANAHTLVLQFLPSLECVCMGTNVFEAVENCVVESA